MITAEFSLQFEFATHLCYKKNFHFKDDIRIVQSYLRIPVSLRCGKASYKKKISNQKKNKEKKKENYTSKPLPTTIGFLVALCVKPPQVQKNYKSGLSSGEYNNTLCIPLGLHHSIAFLSFKTAAGNSCR